jgi:hypothetical protein
MGLMFLMIGFFYFSSVQKNSIDSMSSAFAESKLGDLSKFKKIAVDTQALIAKNDLLTAKLRIKDLETTWDEAEAGLKPRAAKDWHVIDKAIDHALSVLRASPPEMNDCKKTVDELVKTLDSF